jgi:hypothetical protein
LCLALPWLLHRLTDLTRNLSTIPKNRYLGQHTNIITLKDLFVRDNTGSGGGATPAPGANGETPPADELYIVMEVRPLRSVVCSRCI